MTKPNDNPITLFTASGCLTAEALERYVSGGLPAGDTDRLKAHLADCEFCSVALEGIMEWQKQNTVTEYHPDAPKHQRTTADVNHNKNFSHRMERVNERLHDRVKFHQEVATEKEKRRVLSVPSWLAVAASIVLFAGIYLILQHNKPSSESVATEQSGNKTSIPIPALAPDSSATLNQPVVVAENRPAKKQSASQKGTVPVTVEIISDFDVVETEAEVSGFVSVEQAPFPLAESLKPVLGIAVNPETISANKMQEAWNMMSDKESKQAAPSTATVYRTNNAPISVPSAAKEEISEEESAIFMVVEESPAFPGGADKLNRYLSENLHYPSEARENAISGTVFVRFVVDQTGKITNAEVIRGIGGGCDEEALRVVKGMPRWKPGKQRGKPVKTVFNLPVRFSLP